MPRTLICENALAARDRNQFDGCVRREENGRVILTALCGCENSTRLGEYNGRTVATADGRTFLCNQHAIPDPEEDWDEVEDEDAPGIPRRGNRDY
jgi:hypothetical protein